MAPARRLPWIIQRHFLHHVRVLPRGHDRCAGDPDWFVKARQNAHTLPQLCRRRCGDLHRRGRGGESAGRTRMEGEWLGNGAQGLPLRRATGRTEDSARSPLLLDPPLVVLPSEGGELTQRRRRWWRGDYKRLQETDPPRHHVFSIAFCLVTVNITPSKNLTSALPTMRRRR